jgi:hypothetical protein
MTAPSSDDLEAELERMIALQGDKCLDLARRLVPGVTPDDLTQPHDFPALLENWHWNYEDGVLAGLLAAQLTIRRIGRK